MGIRSVSHAVLLLLGCATISAQDQPAQQSFWKIKQGDTVDLSPYKFFLPESRNVELKTLKDKAILIVYIRAFDKSCLEFLKIFEEKAWPDIKNKNIDCYVVGHGDQLPSLVSWCDDNRFTFPIANDPSHYLHNSLCTIPSAFPHIILLDRDHRFCVGIVGGIDPSSEEFMKMVDQVIDVGCPPAN